MAGAGKRSVRSRARRPHRVEGGNVSFTDQGPFTVTEDHVKAWWGGYRDARLFRCAWCGHRFRVGDVARWVYTNDGGEQTRGLSGNPFICTKCDGPRPEILARLRATLAEFTADRFWWFRLYSVEVGEAIRDAAYEEQRVAREAFAAEKEGKDG